MKKSVIFLSLVITITMMAACGGDKQNTNSEGSANNPLTDNTTPEGNPSYDPKRGTGKYTDYQVSPTLDASRATDGEKTYNVKCSACHKLTDEKLVGPGWAGVTGRHTPAWIMNFITNTDEMLDKDPKAQAQLEICLVRMPNQSLTDDEAKNLYEFMRKNDGVK